MTRTNLVCLHSNTTYETTEGSFFRERCDFCKMVRVVDEHGNVLEDWCDDDGGEREDVGAWSR